MQGKLDENGVVHWWTVCGSNEASSFKNRVPKIFPKTLKRSQNEQSVTFKVTVLSTVEILGVVKYDILKCSFLSSLIFLLLYKKQGVWSKKNESLLVNKTPPCKHLKKFILYREMIQKSAVFS